MEPNRKTSSGSAPDAGCSDFDLLYNIVDRVYIARIPEVGTAALGAVGLCFPLIVIITAFSNLFGSGGAPLFSIERERMIKKGGTYYEYVVFRRYVSVLILMVIGFLLARPLLSLFGKSAGRWYTRILI